MIRSLRLVLPSGPILGIFAVLYVISEASRRLLEWWLAPFLQFQIRPGTLVLAVACFSYASFRTTHCHPFYNARYRRWLQTTPWTSRLPLPLGPIHLVWQDGFVLVMMALLAYLQGDLNPLHLLTFSLAVYLAWLARSFWPTGHWAFAYAVAFGLGLIVRLWQYPWTAAAAAALVYGIAYAGLRQSLARSSSGMPWQGDPWREDLIRAGSGQATRGPGSDAGPLGWPFDRLRPKWPAGTGIRSRDAVLVSLLAGWWLYAAASLSSDPAVRRGIVLCVHGAAIVFLAGGRLATYSAGYASPISLWGRLWTLRWIIPGYDRIFVAPLAVVLIGALLPEVLSLHGLDVKVAGPLSLSLALLAGLSIGPSLLNWRLTGQHRLVPGLQQPSIKVG